MEKLVAALLFIILLLSGLLFVKQSFVAYIEGEANFSLTMEPITLDDLPAVTMCFVGVRSRYNRKAWINGRDFSVEAKVSEETQKKFTLKDNKYIETLFGLEIKFSRMRQSPELEKKHKNEKRIWRCYKEPILKYVRVNGEEGVK